MAQYLLRRLLGTVPLLFGITLISFAVIHLAPGKPAAIDQSLNPKVSQEVRLRLEKLYGLDQPLHVQYVRWLKQLVTFDLGVSFTDNRPVIEKIAERVPLTLLINIVSLVMVLAIAVPLGIRSALKPGSVFDQVSTVLLFLFFAAPVFWLALLAMQFFSITLGWFPVSGLKSIDHEYFSFAGRAGDIALHLVLPIAIYTIGSLAGIARYMRSSMSEVLSQPYMCAARAKGLAPSVVIYKHGLRNGVLPIITILGLAVPGLLGGSVILESVFALPGMGRLFYEAVMTRDYPLIMAEVVLGGVLTLAGNLAADIAYAFADPRIRYGGKS